MTLRDTNLDRAIAKDILPSSDEIEKFEQEKANKKLNDKLEKINKKTEVLVIKEQIKSYETILDAIAVKWAGILFDEWQNQIKLNSKSDKMTQDEIEKQKLDIEDKRIKDISILQTKYNTDINKYVELVNKQNEMSGKSVQISSISVYTNIQNNANDKFAKLKDDYMRGVKKLIKLQNKNINIQFEIDKVNQQLAQVPLQIEDQIQKILDTFDMLLGKAFGKLENPNNPEFDVNVLEARIKQIVDPVIASFNPLTSLVGEIPILGILGAMMGQNQSGSISSEELRKLVPTVEVPTGIKEKSIAIFNDIMVLCMTIPTMLIDICVQMINVIYSKLEIITSVIPLGNLFPLNLIPAIITLLPNLYVMMKNLPQLTYSWIEGKVKDKIRESIVLGLPKPNIDPEALKSLLEDAKKNTGTKKSVPDQKKESYQDINAQIYEKIKSYGYTMYDLEKILESYRKIHNGLQIPLTLYIKSVTDSKGNLTVAHGQQTREQSSVQCYKEYLEGQISTSDLKSGLKYVSYDSTRRICSHLYEAYKDLIKEGDYIAVEREIPARLSSKLMV